jgi:aldehyde:ferredoxin oxidoreductase
MGKLLVVDLSAGAWREEPLNAGYARDYLGGSGLGARYLADLLPAAADPFAPANPLIFMTGPLVGTAAPSCGRFEACARSPLTNLWGEGNSGGFWGPELKAAGYDGIILLGQSPAPAVLSIQDGTVALREAGDLWGQDFYATQTALRAQLGERTRIVAIGPAGEKRARFAMLMNDHGRCGGRGGLGAVMGSKNLKAIAVRGAQKTPLADPERFAGAAKAALGVIRADIAPQMLRLGGTAFYVDLGMLEGDVPSRYFTQGYFEGAEKLSGSVMADTILIRNRACHRCAVACGRETRLERFGAPVADGPEYETIGAYGTLLLVDDLEAVSYAGHLCNAYGLDTISAGVTIAFMYYLFDQGIVTAKDLDGLEPRWGDIGPALRMTELIGRREGIGDLLAEGSRIVGRHFGVEELAVQVNGMEVPMHDPRAYVGMGLTYATSPRGACHMQGDMYMLDNGEMVEELGQEAGDKGDNSPAKARMAALRQDWRAVTNALIQCHLVNPPLEHLLGMLNAATGWDVDAGELGRIGARSFNLKRLLNFRLGLPAGADRLPKLLMQPLAEGGAAGVTPDMDVLLPAYYAARGWDDQGRPTPAKLAELGLDAIAEAGEEG